MLEEAESSRHESEHLLYPVGFSRLDSRIYFRVAYGTLQCVDAAIYVARAAITVRPNTDSSQSDDDSS